MNPNKSKSESLTVASGAERPAIQGLKITTVGQCDVCIEIRGSVIIEATNGSWVIDSTEPSKKEMLATILTAKSMGASVLLHWVNSRGCGGSQVKAIVRATAEF